MPFDWREFLIIAHELRNDARESARRTCLGRAYYYIYNLGLEAARQRHWPEPSRSVHKALWDWYQKQSVDWLLDTAGITVCCPGHGYCMAAESMRAKLCILADEARDLSDVQLMNANRIGALKSYVDELLAEASALFTIISGRLYTVSYYLSMLEEDTAAERVLATHSPLRDIEFEFVPTPQQLDANVGAERLDDILTNLLEGIAGSRVQHIRIATELALGEVVIRLSSRQPITAAAFGPRRLELYNRTLGWLGGSLACHQQDGSAAFVIRLPARQSV